MPRFPQLFCFAFMACASPHSTPATDTGGTTNPPPVNSNGHDWPRFGFDEARTSAFDAPTGITAAIVPTMKRQQVAIEGVVDASAIYLHNIQVSGAAHDVFFVTTPTMAR